jgi:prepilin-type N-terminal cleavage/methylation domain-containing protein
MPCAPTAFGRSAPFRVRRGFTLVELLVVIGIIALLIAILMPVLRRAKEAANAAQCSSNQRQLMMAFLMFANEHKGHLPGNYWDAHEQTDPEKRDWLIGDNPSRGNPLAQVADAPEKGTIFRYVNDAAVYRCPSVIAEGTSDGSGSNGKFDYAAFIVFSGAKITNIKAMSTFTNGAKKEFVPTPIICEEEPLLGLNGGNVEGGHCNSDRIGHTHPSSGYDNINGVNVPKGGGYYASIDGSVHFFKEPMECNSWNWTSIAPSGSSQTLGHVPIPGWGWWNRQ